jgi:hypothetical protein
MAMHKCLNHSVCGNQASGRNIFCLADWCRIPEGHQIEIRKDTEKGEHTLRASPSREWLSRAFRYINEKRTAPVQVSADVI